MVTPVWLRIRMPCSAPGLLPPAQPVCGSPSPVMLNPFKSSVTLDAAISRQGAPLTVHVTSPTSLLLSMTASVVVMVPLISVAQALPAHTKRALRNATNHVPIFRRVISIPFLNQTSQWNDNTLDQKRRTCNVFFVFLSKKSTVRGAHSARVMCSWSRSSTSSRVRCGDVLTQTWSDCQRPRQDSAARPRRSTPGLPLVAAQFGDQRDHSGIHAGQQPISFLAL